MINTRIIVAPDGAISTATPLAAGEYLAHIEVPGLPEWGLATHALTEDGQSDRKLVRHLPTEPFDVDDLPTLDVGPWPEGLGLRREDIYGDDGR